MNDNNNVLFIKKKIVDNYLNKYHVIVFGTMKVPRGDNNYDIVQYRMLVAHTREWWACHNNVVTITSSLLKQIT